jgi:hypothetical protein
MRFSVPLRERERERENLLVWDAERAEAMGSLAALLPSGTGHSSRTSSCDAE